MNLTELNFITILIFIILFYFILSFDNTLKSLIISELFWINLYLFSIIVAFLIDDLYILSLTFFFLIFSAVDISIGLILIVIQKKIFKINNLYYNSNFKINFITRKSRFLFFKKLIF